MAEMTNHEVGRMDLQSIAQAFRRAAEYQQAHKAITWEHGTDLVNIVARHGEIIADALESADENQSVYLTQEQRKEIQDWINRRDSDALKRLADVDWTYRPSRHGENLVIRAANATGKSEEIVDVLEKMTRQRDMLLKALKHIVHTGRLSDANHVRDLLKLIAECEK